MKKFFIVVTVCFCALSFCLQNAWAQGAASPQKAVQAYYDALFANNFAAAYNTLSQSDKATVTFDDYIRQNYFDYPMMQYMHSLSSYKIGKIKTAGDQGMAKVTIKEPDGEDVNTFVYRQFVAYGMESLSEEEALARMLELLADAKFELQQKETEVLLVKDDEGWHVFFDWAYHKMRNQKLLEAKELSYSQHIDVLLQAKALYEEVRQMRGNENDMYFVNVIWEINRKIERLEAGLAGIEVADVQFAVADDPAGKHVDYSYSLHIRTNDVVTAVIVLVELCNADGSVAFAQEEAVPVWDDGRDKTLPEISHNGCLPSEAMTQWDGSEITVKTVRVELKY